MFGRMFGRIRKQRQAGQEAVEASDPRQEHILIEAAGRSRIAEVAASARKVPWSLNLLQLLWAAGPVTFLAMQGGYFLGFGHAAPAQNFVFFAVYTLLFGVIGLLARFVAETTHGRRQEHSREQLRNTIDWLPDLLFATRDLAMAEQTLEVRRRQAAEVLLYEVDIPPEGVAVAVREMTGDTGLAAAAEQMEIYRRLGLRSRVQDLVEATAEARMAALEDLHHEAPGFADMLRDRLQGIAPTREDGVRRPEQFLDRLFSAADSDDLSRCTPDDVQAIFVLAFELVNGRQIRRLCFEWSGGWHLGQALDQLEYQSNRFRVAQAGVVSRLRSLAMMLSQDEHSGLDLQVSHATTDTLGQGILSALQDLQDARPKVDSHAGRLLGRALRQVADLRMMRDQWLLARSRYASALARWENLRCRQVEESSDHRRPRWFRRTARGISIREELIELSDDQKLRLAERFCEYLTELDIRREGDRLYFGDQPLAMDTLRRIGIQLTLILEPLVDLTHPSIQRAIYVNSAAYLGGLYVGMSADAKAGLGAAMVRLVRQDLGRMAEWLALRLTRIYHLPLSGSMRRFLTQQYGANPERLEMLAAHPPDTDGQIPPVAPRSEHSPEFNTLLQDRRWEQLLRRGAYYLRAEERRRHV